MPVFLWNKSPKFEMLSKSIYEFKNLIYTD